MRIAMVGPFGLHPNKTMASRALGLARPLVQQGHSAALFMPPWQTPQEADKSWQVDGVSMRYIPLSGGMPGIARRLLRETLAWKPDVVHCFKPKAYSGLVAWWLWQLHRSSVRLVMDTDDWEGWGGWNDLAPYTGLQKRFFAWQEQWGMQHCHTLTVASRTLQSIAWSQGVAPQQVLYLPNGPGIQLQPGFNPAQLSQKKDALKLVGRPVLLVYSRLFEFNVERLVEILTRVRTAVPDLAILFIGAGLYAADAADLRQKLQSSDLLDAVVDVGWTDVDELPLLLSLSDAGLYLMDDTLLNRTKCPVKLADMAALGLPVVAEAVGQVSEYVLNGRSGLLRPTGDVIGLAEDMIMLLRNPDLRREMGGAAREHMQTHFNWEKLTKQLVTQAYTLP